MKILHLSQTTHSGSPIRIVDLTNKYSNREARHLVWEPTTGYRKFKTDLVGNQMKEAELQHWLDWADVIHFHNKVKSLSIFTSTGLTPPSKPSIVQIHSPREDIDVKEVLALPIAILAQYHVRQWPEASFVVPNVVDIYSSEYIPSPRPPRKIPVVSYAPSNWNAKGWNDKGYSVVSPVLKRLGLEDKIRYQLIVQQAHNVVVEMKLQADIGIDEIVTGSYHMSSLEYLALGVACFANLDEQTEAVVKDLTGATTLPWLKADGDSFKRILGELIKDPAQWADTGRQSREWMETYWNPEVLMGHYEEMYDSL